MDDLTAFITARVDEDEAAAKTATAGPWGATGEDILSCSPHPAWAGACVANAGGADGDHIARHDPARVLREVAAKRAIVAEHKHYDESAGSTVSVHFGCELCHWHSEYGIPAGVNWCETLKQLAAVWSDHPDYKQEWAL
jgi:hypothetical protein